MRTGSLLNTLTVECRKVAADGPLILLIAGFIGVGALMAAWAGFADRFSVFIYPETVLVLVVLACAAYGIHTMLVIRPAHPIRYMLDRVGQGLCAMGVGRFLVLAVVFTLFLSAVSSLKSLIPAFDPYHWDPLLAWLDARLYGGIAPWRWLQPFLGRPEITQALNVAYNLWFFIMIGGLLWQLFDVRHRERREQFLMAFVLCWIINGIVLATLLSSVGPCFYGRLMPDRADPYAPLMAYLRHADLHYAIWAVPTQDHLWSLYRNSALGVGSGISAMPSMHISLAWLFFLFARRVHRVAGWLMLAYAGVILVGSVMLGWHYSLDGYASIATTSLIWWVAGCWSRWWCGEARSRLGARGGPVQTRALETR